MPLWFDYEVFPQKTHVLEAWFPTGDAISKVLETCFGTSFGTWLEEVGHWKHVLGGCILFWSLPLYLLPVYHEVNIPFHHMLLLHMFLKPCLTIGPETEPMD
jgi:hypothetical protein